MSLVPSKHLRYCSSGYNHPLRDNFLFTLSTGQSKLLATQTYFFSFDMWRPRQQRIHINRTQSITSPPIKPMLVQRAISSLLKKSVGNIVQLHDGLYSSDHSSQYIMQESLVIVKFSTNSETVPKFFIFIAKS